MPSPRLLYFLIRDQSKKRPEGPAILSPGKKTLDYHQLYRQIYSTALQSTRLGIRPQERLAVVLPNGAEMATAFLEISSVCTCAPLNPAYTVDEYKLSMEDLHVKVLVMLPNSDQPAHKAAASLAIPINHLEPDPEFAGIFRLSSDPSIPAGI